MWFLLRGDSQPPSNRPLSGQVPGVFVHRKRLGGIGDGFTTTPAASIDAGSAGRVSGLILLVELRTDADFYVVATLEECHESPSFVVAAEHRPYCRTPVAKAISAQEIARPPADGREIPHKWSAGLLCRLVFDFDLARRAGGARNWQRSRKWLQWTGTVPHEPRSALLEQVAE